MKQVKKHPYWTIAILLGIATFFYFFHQANAQKEQTANFDKKKDTVVSVTRQPIKNELILAGKIQAEQIANLRFNSSGKMTWVGVKVGDKVKKWQTLASLDKKELEKRLKSEFADYATSLSQFDDIQDQYKSAKENLLLTDTIRRILTRTQHSLDKAVIDYEISEMALKDSVLSTPIEGVVTSIDQPIAGTYITPATATFTVVDPNSIYFRTDIDQEQVTQIYAGQPVVVRLDSFPDLTLNTSIDRIAFNPVAGESSTVYEIKIKLPLDNKDMRYRLGMDGDATITLQSSDSSLVLPSEAVFEEGDQTFVYQKNGDDLVKTKITLGITNDQTSEIVEGLSENDQIVIRKK